jgi:hypothetical protein
VKKVNVMATDSPKKELLPSDSKAPERPGLKEIIERLEWITRSLRIRGRMVVISAGLVLFVVIAIVFSIELRVSDLPVDGRWPLLGALALAVHGIVALFLWDQQKRRGSLYYEEISDELEWRHTRTRQRSLIIHEISGGSIVHVDNGMTENKPKNGAQNESAKEAVRKPKKRSKRPDLAIRLQLREFLDATTLPFTNANLSSTVYLTWFLLCIFTVLFRLSLYKGF